METLKIRTAAGKEMLPVSRQLQRLVAEKGWKEGALLVYCPHTTAGLTVNESADPDVRRDMVAFMDELVPNRPYFRHAEGNSDAHVKTSLFGSNAMLIVSGGSIRLGIWQEVYFCEWDGPRNRELWAQFLPAGE